MNEPVYPKDRVELAGAVEIRPVGYDRSSRGAAVRHAFRLTIAPLLDCLSQTSFGTGEQSSEHLVSMCRILLVELDIFPVDKIGRWVGYIQGVMACHGQLNVGEERDRTRPFFEHAYAVSQA